jgi:TRAP transporter TAXI family solute receptor
MGISSLGVFRFLIFPLTAVGLCALRHLGHDRASRTIYTRVPGLASRAADDARATVGANFDHGRRDAGQMHSRVREGWRQALAAAAVFLFAAMAALSPAVAQQKTLVILGTATPGGGFPVYGAAYSATLNEMDATLSVEPRNTKGSTENIPLIEAGRIHIGQVTGEVTYEALAGIGRPPAELCIVSAMYSNSGMFILRADSPVRSIADLKGKPIAWGAKGSGFVVLARYVFDGLGLDINKDFQAVFLDKAADGPEMVLDGRVAALWGGGVGWPGFVAVAKAPAGARFITPDADGMKRILAKYPFIKPITVPAGSYPGQDAPINAPGSYSLVLASPSLPDDVAYRLARALHRGKSVIATRHAQGSESTLANTLAAAPRQDLIHPGVLRYMREAGILR